MKPGVNQVLKQEFSQLTFIILIFVFVSLIPNGSTYAEEKVMGKSGLKITDSDEIETTRAKSQNCSVTALFAYNAAYNEMHLSYWLSKGRCLSETDPAIRKKCQAEAYEDFQFAKQEILDQLAARKKLCQKLGEAAYNPILKPENFIDFTKVLKKPDSFTPNPYFPLIPGNTWTYHVKDAGGDIVEKIVVQVLDHTKEIQGIKCIVVQDVVTQIDDMNESAPVELTHDWYAQDLDGNVWYFGEIAKNYENGDLDNLNGSWKLGKAFAKAGYIMPSNPRTGDLFRQEFLLGEAEDVATVISKNKLKIQTRLGTFTKNVLLTKEYTPIEPGVYEHKYFVPGIGMVLEENPLTGERAEIIQAVLAK